MSGNGNTGQLINMSTSSSPVAGKFGQALKLASSAYVNVANASSLVFGTNDFSICFWLKPQSVANNPTPMSKENNGATGGWNIYFSLTGDIHFVQQGVSDFDFGMPISLNTGRLCASRLKTK